jgi:hypothetical protein
MKKITILLIGCSLALAGAVVAQQPEESPTKKGGKAEKATQGAEAKPKSTAAEAKRKANAPETKTPETAATPRGAGGAGKRDLLGGRREKTSPAAASPAASAPSRTTAGATPTRKAAEQGKKGKRGRAETATTSATPAPSAAGSASPARPTTNAAASMTPTTTATAATGAAGTNATTATQGTVGKGGKKVETQQIQQIQQQHASFKAQARPDKAPAVTFNQSYRISGAESWQGPQYEVFRTYRPEWHDQGWYRSRYPRVEVIAGGWYFWNNGYWYPAWGYDPGVAYYAYDGPIYVGHRAEPPDRVIADVQAELKDMGYYTGEVDGLLGPLTRQALRDYQADHGLAVTEAIDEPTLDALQLS